MSRQSHSTAFTLIELLVVISIIALLVSLLLPALSSAREASLTVACQHNIRQINVGIQAYATDHRGFWPDHGKSSSYDQRVNQVGGYVTSSESYGKASGLGLVFGHAYISSFRPLICPSGLVPGGNSRHYEVDINRAKPPAALSDFSDSPANFMTNAVANQVRLWPSICWRGKRWMGADLASSLAPAWGPKLANDSPYLYHEEIRPAGAPGTLAVLSDDFTWAGGYVESSPFAYRPQGQFYHNERGYNIGYTDGHVEFVADQQRKIIKFGYDTFGKTQHTYSVNPMGEEMWHAFDGNPKSYNNNYITGLR